MADFVDPLITQEIVDAKDKLVAQADRAEQVINNWEGCQPIPEAPIDGKIYGRKDAGWAEVASGEWGSITGTLSNQTDLQSALDAKLDSTTYTAADVKSKYESNANTNAFTDAEQTKLTGIETGAQVNKFDFSDAPIDGNEYVRKDGLWSISTGGGGGTTWGTITGTLSSQTDLQSALDLKLDSSSYTAADVKTKYESNLDTNAFTDSEKTKLAGIASGAEVNVNADWNSVSGDSQILNKPTLGTLASQNDAPSDGTPYSRQDGAWVSAGGGGGITLEDFTVIDNIDNGIYTTQTGYILASQSIGFDDGDTLLARLITLGVYPSGTTWDQVNLTTMNVVRTNVSASAVGDTEPFPTEAQSQDAKTTIHIRRSSSTGLLIQMYLMCTIYTGANAGNVYIRKATATTTGTWT